MNVKKLEKKVDKLLLSLGKDFKVDYDSGVKAVGEIPKILLNRSRELIYNGKYQDAKTFLQEYKFFEDICRRNGFGFSLKLHRDYENQIFIRKQLKECYDLNGDGPKPDEKRAYE